MIYTQEKTSPKKSLWGIIKQYFLEIILALACILLWTDTLLLFPVILFAVLIAFSVQIFHTLAPKIGIATQLIDIVLAIIIPLAGLVGFYFYWNQLLCHSASELGGLFWITFLLLVGHIMRSYLHIPLFTGVSGTILSNEAETENEGSAVSRIDLSGEELQKPRTLLGDTWRQFRKHKLAMLASAVLIGIVALVVIGPFLYKGNAERIDFAYSYSGMTCERPFGADDLGRDLFARIIQGGRISLLIGITAMAIAMIVGTLVGLLSGYFKILDNPLMRITDIFLSLPTLPLLLVITLLFREPLNAFVANMMSAFPPAWRANMLAPAEIGIFIMTVSIIGLLGWMPTARLVRGEVLTVKEREFVLAARSIGASNRSIIFRHILPNVLSPVIVAATFSVASAIISESALSFLGLGFPPDFPTWGRILFDGQGHINKSILLVFWPGMMISLTVLCVNFIGDGLRDALDPRLRK